MLPTNMTIGRTPHTRYDAQLLEQFPCQTSFRCFVTYAKVKVGNGQETAHSEKNPHSENRGVKKKKN